MSEEIDEAIVDDILRGLGKDPSKKKKNGMTREQAAELYDDLRKNLNTLMSQKGAPGASAMKAIGKKAYGARPSAPPRRALPAAQPRMVAPASGQRAAVGLVLVLILVKVALSGVEHYGLMDVTDAEAKTVEMPTEFVTRPAKQGAYPSYSRDEVRVLKSLDQRRVEIEDRRSQLDKKERELSLREREFAARLTELRDLSERLKVERDRDSHEQAKQLDQLASVYGSMAPAEAAQLMEQLDLTIALDLIERMPGKRIAQILALMSPERALTLTRMLSGGKRSSN